MSVLDDFVRMRLYRKRAAEFEKAIEPSLPIDVQERYRIIAYHYRLLAESEERSEKASVTSRLANWKSLRKPENWLAGEVAQKIKFPRSPLFAADLMEEAVRELLKRAAKNARLGNSVVVVPRGGESPHDLFTRKTSLLSYCHETERPEEKTHLYVGRAPVAPVRAAVP